MASAAATTRHKSAPPGDGRPRGRPPGHRPSHRAAAQAHGAGTASGLSLRIASIQPRTRSTSESVLAMKASALNTPSAAGSVTPTNALRIVLAERRVETLAEGPHIFRNGGRLRQHAGGAGVDPALAQQPLIDRQRQPAGSRPGPWRPRRPPHHARRARAACSRALPPARLPAADSAAPRCRTWRRDRRRRSPCRADRRASSRGCRPERSPPPGRSGRPPDATAARKAAASRAGSAGYRSPARDRRCRAGRSAAPRWWRRSRHRRPFRPAVRAASPDRRAGARSGG